MEKSSILTTVGLPLLALASGWGLAAWRVSRHRSWDAFKSDLELADLLKDSHPSHARWLRDSVAVRLKGRARADSRPRRDLLLVTASMFLFVFGWIYLLVGIAILQTIGWAGTVMLAIAVIFPGGVSIGLGAVGLMKGTRSGYRVPGLSELVDSDTKESRADLGEQMRKLHAAAAELPNPDHDAAVATDDS